MEDADPLNNEDITCIRNAMNSGQRIDGRQYLAPLEFLSKLSTHREYQGSRDSVPRDHDGSKVHTQ